MTTTSEAPGPGTGVTAPGKNRMERLIDGLVNGVVVPMISNGVAFAVFAVLWVAFGAALVWSQGSLDAAWAWVTSLPILIQALMWLLFLPVVAGLWVWETTWPFAIRLLAVVGLAAWNLMIFWPRKAGAAKP